MQNSEFRVQKPQMRRGNSILEVLFAILVAVIGLLGAIAVFPVASGQAEKARILETIANAGRSCVHQFDAAGMRRPDHWYTWVASPPQPPLVPSPQQPNFYDLVTQSNWPSPSNVGGFQSNISYCIDSRFVVANTGLTLPATSNAAVFPYNWQHPSIAGLDNLASATAPRMLRVAFFGQPYVDLASNGSPSGNTLKTLAGNRVQADAIFFIDDDLQYERPNGDSLIPGQDRTSPAIQQYAGLPPELSSPGPGRRQTKGEYSWLATVVPKVDVYSGATSDQYVLSVVMFHKRPSDLRLSIVDNGLTAERTLHVYAPDGYTGGEVALYWQATQNSANDDIAKDRFKLRAGDWILLGGNLMYPLGGGNFRIIPQFQWYRVGDTDDVEFQPAVAASGNVPAFPDRYQRWVTLVGQDWNVALANQQATIVEGVIGVYEKTIRLEYGESL